MTLRIALDHNFPTPIVDALATGIVEAELVPIARSDPRMADLDDHDVVRAAWKRGFLVSCDHDMFEQPLVLATILQTRISSVVALGQGHDHIAASGLLLAHLPSILRRYDPDAAQLGTAGRPQCSEQSLARSRTDRRAPRHRREGALRGEQDHSAGARSRSPRGRLSREGVRQLGSRGGASGASSGVVSAGRARLRTVERNELGAP